MKRVILALICLYAPVIFAEPIQLARNLVREASKSVEEGKIYLLYVSRPECPYCARLEKQVLHPMLKSGDYSALLVLRELSMEGGTLVDFDGQFRPSAEISRRMAIIGTPTLLFLDEQGSELTARITGYYSEDFYWHYFDKAILAARAELAARVN